jgi:hypothetical protein
MKRGVLVSLLLGAGCTNFDRALAEFDSVSLREDPATEPARLTYHDRPLRMPWALRQVEGSGLDRLLIDLFAVTPEPVEVENPAELARERMEGMVATMGHDATRVGLVAARLLWVLDLDEHPLNQIQALDGIERVLDVVGGDPVAWHEQQRRADADPELTDAKRRELLDGALETIEAGWPATRQERPLAGVERDAYLAAFERLRAWPLSDPAEQRKIVLALARGLQFEGDPELREAMAYTLARAIEHAVQLGLRRAVRSRAPEVREHALRTLHRATGSAGVPFLLALIARPAGAVAPGQNRYDDEPAVRRTLVHFCGQLPLEHLMRNYERGPMPAEFLYDVIREEPPVAGLRLAALEALAYGLGTPLRGDESWAEDRSWVDQWWQQYIEQRLGGRERGR